MGIKNVRVCIGKILLEIKYVWLVAAIMAAAKEDAKLVKVSKMEHVNRWRYGLGIFIQTIFQDTEDLPFKIIIPEKNSLKVIVEGQRLNCYLCGKRDHIKIHCPEYEPFHTDVLLKRKSKNQRKHAVMRNT